MNILIQLCIHKKAVAQLMGKKKSESHSVKSESSKAGPPFSAAHELQAQASRRQEHRLEHFSPRVTQISGICNQPAFIAMHNWKCHITSLNLLVFCFFFFFSQKIQRVIANLHTLCGGIERCNLYKDSTQYQTIGK